jgi:predicted  nucleic acid-binding Zn-ribbon protein
MHLICGCNSRKLDAWIYMHSGLSNEGSERERSLQHEFLKLNRSFEAFVEEADTSRANAEHYETTRHADLHAKQLQRVEREASERGAALQAALEALRHADERHARELNDIRTVVEEEVAQEFF